MTITINQVENINEGFEIYYCGWSEPEIIDYKMKYQRKFTGFPDDLKLEITTENNQLYFVRFRIGSNEMALTTQYQFLLIEEKFGLIVNANGNLYRFDLLEKKYLGVDCYSKDICSPILSTAISYRLGIMIVIDQHGMSALSWDKVLWRKDFNYPEQINIPLEIDAVIPVEYDAPDKGKQFFNLNALTGDLTKSLCQSS